MALWDRLLAARWPSLVLHWLWSVHNGPERVHLAVRKVQATELRDRLHRLITSAEALGE